MLNTVNCKGKYCFEYPRTVLIYLCHFVWIFVSFVLSLWLSCISVHAELGNFQWGNYAVASWLLLSSSMLMRGGPKLPVRKELLYEAAQLLRIQSFFTMVDDEARLGQR